MGAASPAHAMYWFIPGRILFSLIPLAGIACFAYLMWVRIGPLLRAAPDPRLDRVPARLANLAKFWLAQWKHPRYLGAGILHIIIFAGFLVLSVRSLSLVMLGMVGDSFAPAFMGSAASVYGNAKDYAATLVLLAAIVAAVRRLIIRPARYAVPRQYGNDHTREAVGILALIAVLMVSESLFEASDSSSLPAKMSLAWAFKNALVSTPQAQLNTTHLGAYLVHELTFFAFLCILPLGKHFHVITSIFNVYFAKLDRAALKPVRWGLTDVELSKLNSAGVKTFEDFTWKHMLDFYSCADCGRCSDQCPANAAGRPLSPRFLTLKAREYMFQKYRVPGRSTNGTRLAGNIITEEEVWSCTTCGSCEQECPLLLEYIDKIVDLRRGLVDDGRVPQSLHKPLKALESRGNPYGKPDKKRADWAKSVPGSESRVSCDTGAETLYFVDSATSYDDRLQAIARATASILDQLGENFAILGAKEKDSGHEARRFGEETLFLALREHNSAAIQDAGVKRIVTADPHAYNALKNDYGDLPPVEHISQVLARAARSGALKFQRGANTDLVYAYHDPCYLGRHNQIYAEPRAVLDAIPGLKRVEMRRSRDRSFCCGGGGLMLFYEAKETERMGVTRVRMAAEAGANVIVTACPFCMVNLEDAIKVAGLEGKMKVTDLTELVVEHLATPSGEACVPATPLEREQVMV
ncbi:MAG: (Fe-S)-binding protein [Terriglobales bacterium]